MKNKTILNLGILLTGLFSIASASAGTVVQCGQAICSANFSINAGGQQIGTGEFDYDAETGVISLSSKNITGGGITWDLGSGESVSVNSVSGNADPILGFAVAATTGAVGSTYAFAFNLPIAIEETIATKAKVGYTLTSTTAAGAQITDLGNKILQSWDVDTSPGGLGSLNKNVDVGETHFHTPGPDVTTATYEDTATIVGSLAYDLMAVQVAFAQSADSNVGVSGFVSQTPVPVPAAGWLMLTGLGFLTVRKRRTISA